MNEKKLSLHMRALGSKFERSAVEMFEVIESLNHLALEMASRGLLAEHGLRVFQNALQEAAAQIGDGARSLERAAGLLHPGAPPPRSRNSKVPGRSGRAPARGNVLTLKPPRRRRK